MTWATVKKTTGFSLLASNTLKNTAGASVVVSNDVLDTAAGTHTVFAATQPVNPIVVFSFRLSDTLNRVFKL